MRSEMRAESGVKLKVTFCFIRTCDENKLDKADLLWSHFFSIKRWSDTITKSAFLCNKMQTSLVICWHYQSCISTLCLYCVVFFTVISYFKQKRQDKKAAVDHLNTKIFLMYKWILISHIYWYLSFKVSTWQEKKWQDWTLLNLGDQAPADEACAYWWYR